MPLVNCLQKWWNQNYQVLPYNNFEHITMSFWIDSKIKKEQILSLNLPWLHSSIFPSCHQLTPLMITNKKRVETINFKSARLPFKQLFVPNPLQSIKSKELDLHFHRAFSCTKNSLRLNIWNDTFKNWNSLITSKTLFISFQPAT